jgi:hypothetical protein
MAAALAGEDLARQTSSRSWRSTSVREMWDEPDVFQRSGRLQAVDDEEELKWAAIERLPTYDRLRTGMLRQVMSNGRVVHDEIDVTKLGTQEKKQLMESILKFVEEDNEKFLRRLRARTDRLVSIYDLLSHIYVHRNAFSLGDNEIQHLNHSFYTFFIYIVSL